MKKKIKLNDVNNEELTELEVFEKQLFLSKYKYGKAKLYFFALRDNFESTSEKNDFENFVAGIGVIEFTFLSEEGKTKTYKVEFSRIKGFDINVELEFINFKTYAKKYLDEISQQLGFPVMLESDIILN